MALSLNSDKINEWMEIGKKYNNSHIIIIFDTISHTYWPVYYHPSDEETLENKQNKYKNHNRFNFVKTILLS
jgi:hypothetical protein